MVLQIKNENQYLKILIFNSNLLFLQQLQIYNGNATNKVRLQSNNLNTINSNKINVKNCNLLHFISRQPKVNKLKIYAYKYKIK